MGWKRGLAGLALCAGAAGGWTLAEPEASSAGAAEPGASVAVFEGRDYFLIWPAGTPTELLVYLHAEDAQALGYEARSGMLEALAADGASRGYAVVAPSATQAACEPSGGEGACWRLDAVAEELAYLERLVAAVEAGADLRFETRSVVGYARGGALLVAGLTERRLDGWRKVGLLDAGASVAPLPTAAADGPLIYLEAAEGDRASAAATGELLADLVAAGYGPRTCAHGDLGGRAYDLRRFLAFLVWFAEDCRLGSRAEGGPPVEGPVAGPASAPASARVEAAETEGGRQGRRIAGVGGPR
jgi:hypothetical protein